MVKRFFEAEWSFIGVVVFFITHGYSQNLFLVPLPALFMLLAILLAAALALFFIAKKVFRNTTKATLFASFVLILILFFGAMQEFLVQYRFTHLLGRLVVLVPLSLLAMLLFFIFLKRTKRTFTRTIIYLNVLLLVYILIDTGVIIAGITKYTDQRKPPVGKNGWPACDTCSKPSVYLVMLDSYFGSEGMRRYFNYDNRDFENYLQSEGFQINKGSLSNYTFTVFSIASTFNMDYLRDPGSITYNNHYAYTQATRALQYNKVMAFFAAQGYTINNYSSFDMSGLPAYHSSELLPDKIRLITKQTMFYRVNKYLGPFLIRKGWLSPEKMEEEYIGTMEEMMQKVLNGSSTDKGRPDFTYLHLMMPHGPYVFDSLGNRMINGSVSATGSSYDPHEQFLQYQVYTNRKISGFISQLKQKTGGKAAILLMSDHGYRPSFKMDRKLSYCNLNALYLPRQNYSGWYDGISNVNQFRVLFNALYGENLPLLKDSMVVQ